MDLAGLHLERHVVIGRQRAEDLDDVQRLEEIFRMPSCPRPLAVRACLGLRAADSCFVAALCICAAVATAITAGSLERMPPTPIGQISACDAVFGNARLAQALLEARPLGGAADQADMGKAGVAQRRIGDGQVERMAVAS